MTEGEHVAQGLAALAEGRWGDARDRFEEALAFGETAEASFGLASALWWLGENVDSVEQCSRAYTLYRRAAADAHAAHCAIWLAITYKANFANYSAANGWIGRAERLLAPFPPGPLHGWVAVARAYRSLDLDAATRLTEGALEAARRAGDVDLELVALSQLGLVRVAQGEVSTGFALIDEAVAAALAGERSTLDTVVYTCCDMLTACELADDLERAAQWCTVADDFVRTYGCPFLYAECRILYGAVLTARGHWPAAEHELRVGLRITEGACPGLHARGLTRLAALRVRQGRLEEAEHLLAQLRGVVEAEAEETLTVAALLLARGDAPTASRNLGQRLHQLGTHRFHLAVALDLIVDALLAGEDVGGARAAARLAEMASSAHDDRLTAMAAACRGRVSAARGESDAAVTHLQSAMATWSRLHLPFELARTRFDLALALASGRPEAAAEHARQALATFDELGAALEADRVAAFLRSLGVRARTGVKGAGVLTAREQEVLQLLGAGLSNPEIAARLFVSRKTASHHVSSVLAKLHLRNRAEAAAYAVAASGAPAGRPVPG